jgi:hypothetical protein
MGRVTKWVLRPLLFLALAFCVVSALAICFPDECNPGNWQPPLPSDVTRHNVLEKFFPDAVGQPVTIDAFRVAGEGNVILEVHFKHPAEVGLQRIADMRHEVTGDQKRVWLEPIQREIPSILKSSVRLFRWMKANASITAVIAEDGTRSWVKIHRHSLI